MSDFLSGPTASDIRGRKPANVAPQLSQRSSGIDALVAKVGAIESPFGQAFARGLIKRRFDIDVPSPEEHELAKAQAAHDRRTLAEDERGDMVRFVTGFLVDNANKPADEAFAELSQRTGLTPVEGSAGNMKLGDFLRLKGVNAKLDIGLLERPEELQNASRVLSMVFGDSNLQLRTEDLLLFPLTRESASQTVEARARAGIRDEARTGKATDAVAERRTAVLEGDSPLNEVIETGFGAAEDSGEEQFGGSIDLDPSGFDDLDEVGGVAAFASGAKNVFNQLVTLGETPEFASEVLLSGRRGKRIGEILRDRIEVSPEGEAIPTDEVSRNQLIMVDDLARSGSASIQTAFRSMGLEDMGVTSVNTAGLRASLEAESDR